MSDTRYATVASNWRDPEPAAMIAAVQNYLPGNYEAIGAYGDKVVIAGDDSAGWTFENYVEPRLASGLYFATEIKEAVNA